MIKKLFSLPIVVVMLVSLVLATVAAAPPPQAEDKTYTVQKDDWLSKLADKEYGDPLAFTAIYYYNNLKAAEDDSLALIEDPDLIEVGWSIYLPSPEEVAAYLAGDVPGGTPDDQDDSMSNSNDDEMSNANDDDMSNSNDDDDDSNSSDDDAGSNRNGDDESNSNDDDHSNSNDDDHSNSNDDDHSNSNDNDND